MSQAASAATPLSPPRILDRGAYLAWYDAQPRGRFERVQGEIFRMAPERAAHLEVKAAVWLALRRAVAAAGVACHALPDGATIRVGDRTDYEPDAVVYAGERIARDAIAVPNPLVIVEVLSPSTRALDTGLKLTDYVRVPSVRHYLIVRADEPQVVHHRRRDDDSGFDTRVLATGEIRLDPPGLRLAVEEFYEA